MALEKMENPSRAPSVKPFRLKSILKEVLPYELRIRINTHRRRVKRWIVLKGMRRGFLRLIEPIRPDFGNGFGRCIDRYYIEGFLAEHAADIRGKVLEVAEDTYTYRYGGDKVVKSDILYRDPGFEKATIVADLTKADHLTSDLFDAVILTQTLQFIYDTKAAIHTLYRILKPGGVLLVTVPGISQICRYDIQRWGEYWRFTRMSAQRIFSEAFSEENVVVQAYGNVLSAVAFMHGLTVEEVKDFELDYHDPVYEVIIAVRAVKPYEPAPAL